MENQQEKFWVVKVQKTPDSTPFVAGTFETKYEANRCAVEVWTENIFKVFVEYE